MKRFPVIVTELKDSTEIKSKSVFLDAKKPKEKNQRTKAINDYLKRNGYANGSLCCNCVKGPLECIKVADISKKMIFEYPFILEGYQVQDQYSNLEDKKYCDVDASCDYERDSRSNNLRIEKFVVTKCKNFKMMKKSR